MVPCNKGGDSEAVAMKVHVGYCVSEESKNPFRDLFVRAIKDHPAVSEVTTGTNSVLDSPSRNTDILHLHWPEALTDWTNPSSSGLEAVSRHLDAWRETAHVVTTVHNRHPHSGDTNEYRNLYRIVYERTDGFVHFGDASRHILAADHPSASRNADHVIIPHGRYTCFEQDVERLEARRKLGYGEHEFVVLTFGALREPEELDLVVRGFVRCRVRKKRLLIASRVSWPSRKRLTYYRIRGRLLADWRIRVKDEFIPDDEVAYFLRAADVLVIPRLNALNSGNVALGFTFGTVVVGPKIGVIGETLANTGNPTYSAGDAVGLGEALNEAQQARERKVRRKNESFARSNWNWKTIAEQHVSFYRQLIQSGAG